MKTIRNFNGLDKILPYFKEHDLIVIIAGYNYGKSSVCSDMIMKFFGNEVLYATFTDQSKPNFIPRKSQLEFNQKIKGQIILFDEILDDTNRDIRTYLKDLIDKNKVIILTNPYGQSSNPEKELGLFKTNEASILIEKTLYIFVEDKIR